LRLRENEVCGSANRPWQGDEEERQVGIRCGVWQKGEDNGVVLSGCRVLLLGASRCVLGAIEPFQTAKCQQL
jgi:hypothetical protein